MKPFTEVEGRAAPLMRANIDTDVIIRIERLTEIPNDQLGPYAFESIRYLEDGAKDPAFIPGRDEFAGAPILITGDNFGCGSSRESAVWAIQAMGIRCLIAPGFGDIFRNNCFQNGVLPIVMPEAEVKALAALALDGARFRVDLRENRIEADGRAWPFELERLRKDMLLAGLDEIELTLRDDDDIRAWQERDRQQRPWIWQLPESDDPLNPPT